MTDTFPFTFDELHSLASETRLKIIAILREKKLSLKEITQEIGLDKSTLYEHLRILIQAGLVQKNNETPKKVYYTLTQRTQNIMEKQ